jgi:hypothetical protein
MAMQCHAWETLLVGSQPKSRSGYKERDIMLNWLSFWHRVCWSAFLVWKCQTNRTEKIEEGRKVERKHQNVRGFLACFLRKPLNFSRGYSIDYRVHVCSSSWMLPSKSNNRHQILKSLLINLDWNYLNIEENKPVSKGYDLCWHTTRFGASTEQRSGHQNGI